MLRRHASAALLCAIVAACSGDSATNPAPPVPPTSPAATPAAVQKSGGDGQAVRLGSALPAELAVTVTTSTGVPVPNVDVQWTVGSGHGSVSSVTTKTDAQGIARVRWTLGNRQGSQSAQARVGSIPAVSFSATAMALYTYMVYMAADNNLSSAGVKDIDEMEVVGSSDSMNVVLQAEFSPKYTAMSGCTAACFNRPNYNTFRYRVGRGNTRRGPDGAVEDIGNRNMTDPADLADFIRWSKLNYPAEQYVLVLWNHGGGYEGLLQDETSSGSRMMSVSELRTALVAAATPIALIDFDMCLMGGAETLLSIRDLTSYAVFSEDIEPGDGNPYDRILGRLRASPTMSPRQFAQVSSDEFVTSYRGSRNSVTKSAAELARLPQFTAAWDALAVELNTNLDTHRAALAQAIPASQSYEFPYLRDLGDFLTRLRAATSSAQLQARIDGLQGELGGIVVRNAFYSSTAYGAANVDRSTGLTVLLPAGGTADALPSHGPGSLASYKGLYPSSAWTTFLDRWLASTSASDYFDQGANQMEMALVWDSAGVSRGVDLDLWVLEPSGNLYIPYLGTVTPNGTFGGSSESLGTYFETYSTRRYVERGVYYFFAELYADPQNFQPAFTFLYHTSPTAPWIDLYQAPYPRLSLANSWLSDPTPSLQEAAEGKYSDLKLAGYWDLRATQANGGSAASLSQSVGSALRVRPAASAVPGPQLTTEQFARVAALMRDPVVRATRAKARAEAAETGAVPSGISAASARVHTEAP
jgi:hypothetical protein